MFHVINSVAVSVSVAVSKMLVVLHRTWSKSQWKVLLGYLEQILAAIKHTAADNVLQQDTIPCALCTQHSPTATGRNSQLSLLSCGPEQPRA